MITESDWARLARLHTGECDPSEAEDLRRWVEADPERTEALEFMGATAALKPAPQMRDTETAWARLVSRRRARLLRAPLLRRVTADAAPSRRSPACFWESGSRPPPRFSSWSG